MSIIPNTTGAIAFVSKYDPIKPYICVSVVTAWKIENIEGREEVDPILNLIDINDGDCILGYYHADYKTLETMDRVSSIVFEGEYAYLDAKYYMEDFYEKEVV